MEYNFSEIEAKWKKKWADEGIYKVKEDPTKPKFYVLDMFPYPSGAGLHVGHPLGYVASDIYARFKRLKGFNVLHPMGYDAFGLPAEQYAIETGTPPAQTTEKAIARYREQLDKIGFSFDWSRQVKTSEPEYYKWTQWIFLKLYGSWYNREKDKAESIDTLIAIFEKSGNQAVLREGMEVFTEEQWAGYNKTQKEQALMNFRLAFLSYAEVNWCEALGTVLANDEVKDGKSERGGHPVERRKMRQWFLRITEYSDRLLEGLERVDWTESMKEMQRNWIGRSEGALVKFKVLSPGSSQVLTPNPSPKERGTDAAPYYMSGHPVTSVKNIVYAKDNRKNPTEAGEKLWGKIRNQKLGEKFRRQHLIDKYIVDFVCLSKNLIIEVVGDIHEFSKDEDANRTSVLNELGYKVIRFSNEQVVKNIDGVLKEITKELNASPLLGRGAGGEDGLGEAIEVFTTRPDTIFGATFMVIAAEHEMVEQLTTPEQKEEVEKYIAYVKSRTDVERQQEKKVTGVFTGSYAINPFTNQPIPVWIAEYVLSGYGTGAIMAVPSDDERDNKFATKFGLPIIEVIDRSQHPGAEMGDKVGTMINSGFLNGLEVKDALKKIIDAIEYDEIGERKVNYKQRDAGYSRQRYWGEPFPIRYKVIGEPDGHFENEGEHDDIPVPLSESELPLILPEVTTYKPAGDGRSPLANSAEWVKKNYETDTMPGYAGSSWYFLRYMDAHNDKEFAAKDKLDYWQNVDVYFGGAEHAVGHLLYSRMWHKFLYDLGYVKTDEPFQKLVNQGMIQGRSSFAYRLGWNLGTFENNGIWTQELRKDIYFSKEYFQKFSEGKFEWRAIFDVLKLEYPELYKILIENKVEALATKLSPIHIPIEFVNNDILDIETFKKSNDSRKDIKFIPETSFICGSEVEKMSKSKYNVVNPDDVIDKYGADCFRMFEMFLGPIEQSKPWDDKGISGVYNFLRKFWRMFYDDAKGWKVTDEKANNDELKVLHKTLKKIAEDIEKLSFNTSVSAFMIATNELTALGCNKKEVLQPLLIALAPFAPFITEQLWSDLGNKESIHKASFPTVEENYLVEDSFNYPVSINGKVRAQVNMSLALDAKEVEKQILEMESIQKWTNGAAPKKFIFVKGKIINVVV